MLKLSVLALTIGLSDAGSYWAPPYERDGRCDGINTNYGKECPPGQYCQPWNLSHYQCIDRFAKCQEQWTNWDFYGDDIKTIYGVQPSECCEKCTQTPGCKAYTFHNAHSGSPACYLKSGKGEMRRKTGVVSGVVTTESSENWHRNDTLGLKNITSRDIIDNYRSSSFNGKVTPPYFQCGDEKTGFNRCTSGFYCYPKKPTYYQCRPYHSRCFQQYTNIDYKGFVLDTIPDIKPDECCKRCDDHPECRLYSFVISEKGEKVKCLLKGGKTYRYFKHTRGAVSGFTEDFTTLSRINRVDVDTVPIGKIPAKATCGDENGHKNCIEGHYCQPWNKNYYQCITKPKKCPEQYTDKEIIIGKDLEAIYGLSPEQCCNQCNEKEDCIGYTFFNAHPKKTLCQLKRDFHISDAKYQPGTVSAFVDTRRKVEIKKFLNY